MGSCRRVLATAVALATLGCADPVVVARSDGVEARVRQEAVDVTNRRSSPIVVFLMDAATAARANWIACAQPDCPKIPPDESRTFPANEIGGWGESDQLIVFWWHVVPAASGGFEPDSIRGLVVRY